MAISAKFLSLQPDVAESVYDGIVPLFTDYGYNSEEWQAKVLDNEVGRSDKNFGAKNFRLLGTEKPTVKTTFSTTLTVSTEMTSAKRKNLRQLPAHSHGRRKQSRTIHFGFERFEGGLNNVAAQSRVQFFG